MVGPEGRRSLNTTTSFHEEGHQTRPRGQFGFGMVGYLMARHAAAGEAKTIREGQRVKHSHCLYPVAEVEGGE